MALNVDYLERILRRLDWRKVAEYLANNVVAGGGGGGGLNPGIGIGIGVIPIQVPTQPTGTNNNQAASTAFVISEIAMANLVDAESLTLLLGQIVTALRLLGVDPAELEPGFDESIMIAN